MKMQNYRNNDFSTQRNNEPQNKIHINDAINIITDRITMIESALYNDSSTTTMDLDNSNSNSNSENEMDSAVLSAIIERIEKLEKQIQTYDELRSMIETNTKNIEELQRLNNEESEEEENEEEEQEEEQEVQQNVNLIVEDVSDSENDEHNDTSYGNNCFERNRLFVKPTF